jgi:tRNA(Arg) A34 adenosine deaminase TadA
MTEPASWTAEYFSLANPLGPGQGTSCQPCQMCTGAIARSGLGRVVYALSSEQLISLNPGSDWPVVPQDGPALFDEARTPIEDYNQPR